MEIKRLFLAIVVITTMFAVTANSFNADGTNDDYFSFNVDGIQYAFIENRTAVVVEPSDAYKSMTEVTIPDVITYEGNQYPVKKIASDAFLNCVNIQSVSIGNNVKEIWWSSFDGCTGLTEIDIPNSVEHIEESAFENCSNLEKLTVGESVNYIFFNAFDGCPIKEVIWNAKNLEALSISTTNNDPFWSEWYISEGFEEVQIGDKVECIPYSLARWSKITSITIPQSVKTIQSSAFSDCSQLREVIVDNADPANITLDESVFSGINYDECVLTVPKGSAELYRQANVWKNFTNIQEKINTSIEVVNAAIDADNGAYYDMQGRRIGEPVQPGIYIHNGKKFIVR